MRLHNGDWANGPLMKALAFAVLGMLLLGVGGVTPAITADRHGRRQRERERKSSRLPLQLLLINVE